MLVYLLICGHRYEGQGSVEVYLDKNKAKAEAWKLANEMNIPSYKDNLDIWERNAAEYLDANLDYDYIVIQEKEVIK